MAHANLANAYAVTITADIGDIRIPKGYHDAITCAHSRYWLEAIAKETAGLMALNTWTPVLASSMPLGSNLMHCHFVFALKRNSDGTVSKWKARLTANGDTQVPNVDYSRIFSSVVKTQTIRLVLIIAAANNYDLSSIDIRQAYLQAEVKEDLYMRMPPNLPAFDALGRQLVCKLNRSLYGLKQAGRYWNELISSFLVSWGMKRSTIDVCLFTYYDGKGGMLWILLYVDDALILSNSPPLRSRFVADLSKRFPTEDKGELEWILNVAIRRDRSKGTLSMSQSLYVSDMLSRYSSYVDSSNTRRFDSPMEEGLFLEHTDSPTPGSAEQRDMAPRREAYMGMVGGFLWLANMTRDDIAYAASQLARFTSNPGSKHFAAAVRVLLYLRDHDRPLVFAPDLARPFEVYVDSNWATRFSCSGAYFFYYGCRFHWFSRSRFHWFSPSLSPVPRLSTLAR